MKSGYSALKKLGYILKFYRRSRDLSQSEMAQALRISLRNFQRIEAGEVEPKLETLVKVATFLDIPVSSLIRPTSKENLLIKDLCSRSEEEKFVELDSISTHTSNDLEFAAKMIENDRQVLPDSRSGYEVEVHGTVLHMPPTLEAAIGHSTDKLELEGTFLIGTIAERWELIFRLNLKSILVESLYSVPVGLRIFQSYHHTIDPNPDNPRTRSYLRDTTQRYQLEQWLSDVSKKMTLGLK